MSQNESKEAGLNEDEAEEKLTQQINAITPATTNDSIIVLPLYVRKTKSATTQLMRMPFVY